MAQQRNIFVYRFDYELKGEHWHAFVAGYNQQESQEYLLKIAPNAVVSGISQECTLHAISDQLRQTILDSSKKKPGRPKGSGKKTK